MALGSLLWGVGAEIHQVGIALIVAGLVQIVALVVALPFRLTEVDDLDLAPMREFTAPDTQVGVDARSGPVVITITYPIAEQDEGGFLPEIGKAACRERVCRDGVQSVVAESLKTKENN